MMSWKCPDCPETVRVRDRGLVLEIPFEACRLYHGEDSIGGLALGYRLVAFALAKLSPGEIPERKDIAFRTAFPGPGVLDAVEMTTRAASRSAVRTLTEAPPEAPEATYGHLYFEFTVKGKTLRVAAAPGAMSEEFLRTGRAVVAGGRDPALLAHWTEVKRDLARAVMAADAQKLFLVL